MQVRKPAGVARGDVSDHHAPEPKQVGGTVGGSSPRPNISRQHFARHTMGGFRIGFNPGQSKLKARPTNMPSAEEHPDNAAAYLEEELAQGGLVVLEAGMVESLGIHTSTFGVIPQKEQAQ